MTLEETLISVFKDAEKISEHYTVERKASFMNERCKRFESLISNLGQILSKTAIQDFSQEENYTWKMDEFEWADNNEVEICLHNRLSNMLLTIKMHENNLKKIIINYLKGIPQKEVDDILSKIKA